MDAAPGYRMLQVRVTGAAGREHEELGSYLSDAEFALAALERLRAGPGDDGATMFSLWSSAAIAYARIFLPGSKRDPIGTSVVAGTEHEAIHRGLMEFRGQQIAHRSSDAEQWRSLLLLTARELPDRKVEGVGHFAIKMVAVGPEDLERTVALVEFVKAEIERRLAAVQERIMASAGAVPFRELDECAARGAAWRCE